MKLGREELGTPRLRVTHFYPISVLTRTVQFMGGTLYMAHPSQRRTRLQELVAKIRGDGCSMSPDLWFKEACDEHDVAYRTHQWLNRRGDLGGPTTKARADTRLWRGIKNRSPLLPRGLRWMSPTAAIYWIFVAVFGHKAWRTGPDRFLQQLRESQREGVPPIQAP